MQKMEKEKELFLNELRNSKYLKVILTKQIERVSKNSEMSQKARKKGNDLYISNDHTAQTHEGIFKLYSQSIASAPNDTEELAIAYGNRSALLLHLHKYKECLSDIERALKITKSSSLTEKLLSRKMKCLSLQDSNQNQEKQLLSDVESQEKIDLSKYLASKEQEDSSHSVTIKYNEKYGRHLVAARDFKPGEIILVEKPYVSFLNIKYPYIHCCHCLKVAWNGIPCDDCAWFMFCSEECKSQAWKEYHDIECSCMSYILHFLRYIHEERGQAVCFDGLSIRALIIGLREYGSLEKLKAEMQLIDQRLDKQTKGFSKDGKFENNSFRSLYSLSSKIPFDEEKNHVTFALVALACIAKYTNFFPDELPVDTLDNLIKNPNFILVGSLILKLSKISNINSHGIVNVNDNCKFGNDLILCRKNWCCVKGVCIAPIASLTNHSCNPNARRCFTDDSKFILYALQSIKKNSQIFDSYHCTFFETPNPYRQNVLQDNFSFKCDCIACKQNWPAWPIVDTIFEIQLTSMTLTQKELEMWERNKDLIKQVENGNVQYNRSIINNLSKAIVGSMKNLAQPSVVTYKLVLTLMVAFEKLHGYSLNNFNSCKN